MKIYFITGNKGKLEEAMSVIPEIEAKNIDLPELQEIDAKKIIEIKLAEAAKNFSDDLIVEDTSLYLEGMNGLPGSLIKWFVKTIGNDGLVKLANTFGNKAEAKVWIGYLHLGKVEFFEGSINGKIVEPRGTNGFAWDTIFEVGGTGKTFAEMTAEEKNAISMRRIAFEKLRKFLENR
jgi:non-canonical purine NTP pyrophosphatase (RdgB/HAM1 family)